MFDLQGDSVTDPVLLLRNQPYGKPPEESESSEDPPNKEPEVVPRPLADDKGEEEKPGDILESPPPLPKSPHDDDEDAETKEVATAALGSPKIAKVPEDFHQDGE